MMILILLCLCLLTNNYAILDPPIYHFDNEPIMDIVDFKTFSDDNKTYLWTIEDSHETDGIIHGRWIRLYKNGIMVYENDFKAVKPWCIEIGDLDGDDQYEVIIGTYNKAPFYDIAKRPFVFNWDEKILSKRWTGSSLGFDTLEYFKVVDIDNNGIYEIVTIEKDNDYQRVSYVYRWVNFGFTQEAMDYPKFMEMLKVWLFKD